MKMKRIFHCFKFRHRHYRNQWNLVSTASSSSSSIFINLIINILYIFIIIIITLSTTTIPTTTTILVDCLPKMIKIGGIFSPDQFEQATVFRYAIDRLNNDNNMAIGSSGSNGNNNARILPKTKLQANIVQINLDDSFHGHKQGLMRIQEFLKEAEKNEWNIRLYQIQDRMYRDIFWEIKQNNINNLLLDLDRDNIFLALKHAQQVGMMTENQNYLITSLDLHTINLENFQYAKTKITALSLIDFSSKELHDVINHLRFSYRFRSLPQPSSSLSSILSKSTTTSTFPDPPIRLANTILTESALLYDSVRLFATALKDLDQSQSISMPTTSCTNMNPWLYGTSLMNYMRPISFQGITGLVGFDQQGKRSHFRLHLMTITRQGLQTVGSWDRNELAYKRLKIKPEWQSTFQIGTLENKTLRVTTILNDPYCMYTESSETKIGNERFEGYIIDLVEELSKLLGFKYIFKLVDDGVYGTNENGEWNGLIGEVIKKKADIAVVDLTITSKRAEAVDFTLPFMNTGISILFKKPTTKVTTLFSFLSPLSSTVWCYVLAAYVGVSTVLFFVGRMSPYEWENPNPCRENDGVLENNFSQLNSFFFTIGSLMQQGSDLAPKAMSTRTIAGLWYFFTLIMISSYTANLAAFLTVEKVIYPIKDAEDLSKQTTIEYGCLNSGSTKAFFRESNLSTFKRMYEFMKSRPHVFMAKNEDGRKRVERGNYAYLMESASIEYIIERNCNLTQIGGLLDTKGYGIATRKRSKYRNLLSEAILKLQESGRLLELKEKWWKQKKGGGQCIDDAKKSSSSVTALKMDNVGGVFVVLIGGLALAFCLALCEFWFHAKTPHKACDVVCEELSKDLKFAMMCQSKTKPNRDPSPRSRSLSSSTESYNTVLSPNNNGIIGATAIINNLHTKNQQISSLLLSQTPTLGQMHHSISQYSNCQILTTGPSTNQPSQLLPLFQQQQQHQQQQQQQQSSSSTTELQSPTSITHLRTPSITNNNGTTLAEQIELEMEHQQQQQQRRGQLIL
ncbi:glutamate receptor ionotropic, kainate 2 isoform X2 [Dermatophagoides farinae]|uniref:glutamate receptor ionotropic, kainate 2 isoform X2 n=1 Tax=Dermatophagoides farinae TaxID=6954 RepID=UPI003F60CCEF